MRGRPCHQPLLRIATRFETRTGLSPYRLYALDTVILLKDILASMITIEHSFRYYQFTDDLNLFLATLLMQYYQSL
ncbi:hypothetical protein QE152_g32572 [Popillia japonica]|uniref:Uncharacterized protein n=1 Tax=Popillia japonica TaxID=7064 RepID=A0AAW1IZ51_POPJA